MALRKSIFLPGADSRGGGVRQDAHLANICAKVAYLGYTDIIINVKNIKMGMTASGVVVKMSVKTTRNIFFFKEIWLRI